MKITFVGAGSTVFARNVLGDCMLTESLHGAEMALYDIDGEKLEDSYVILEAMNKTVNAGRARLSKYLGVENRKAALKNADFVVTAIQVGFYDPCTIIDFEVPKKYGLRQTIADTLGIGGIFRALRSIPVFADICRDMEEVAPRARLLNYVNPMAMITGYVQRYTNVPAVGLCHSVQCCSRDLLRALGIDKIEGHRDLIAGINHMSWLLKIEDKDGNDLYPEIRAKSKESMESGLLHDLVRYEYIQKLGYYCTESSEHNAEYNMFFIKDKYPELIERYHIPLDEYPRRCVEQIASWKRDKEEILQNAERGHERSLEYGSYIMEAVVTNTPLKIGGNVLNTGGLIENLPAEACVEVPCMIDGNFVNPCAVGRLPVQLAAMNMTNINVQLCTIEAAHTLKKEHIYHAAMMDPHTASELSLDDIVAMCDELIQAHGSLGYLPEYK